MAANNRTVRKGRSAGAPAPGRRPERRHRHGLTAVGSGKPGPQRVEVRRLRHRASTSARIFILVALSVMIMAWVLLSSPWVRLAEVAVEGGDDTLKGRIRTLTGPQMGEPLLKIDTARLQREIAEDPAVSRVDVLRDWPSKLRVNVTVRVPVMALRGAEGDVELADATGTLFRKVSAAPSGVPVAVVDHPDRERAVRAAASAMGTLDGEQLARVQSIRVQSPEDVRFVLGDVSVVWGGPSDNRRKALILAALLQQKGVRTVNVSAPDSPVASS